MKVFKFLIRFILSLILAIVLIVAGLYLSGNSHLVKAVRSTYLVGKTGPTIDDLVKFENRTVASGVASDWPKSNLINNIELNKEQEGVLEKWNTSAFLIIKGGEIYYEKYEGKYSSESQTNSFSVAKSFVSLAIGAAIQEGLIESVDQKVSDFIPEFANGNKSEITIKNVLQMSSGIDFGESYGDPFGFMAKAYYGSSLYGITVEKKIKFDPGTIWKYQGGNSLLLSFIIKKATGMSLSDYFSTKVWQKVGAKNDALWTISEDDKLERAYCCFYSNARDFARIGQLLLDSGSCKGGQIISKSYFLESLEAVNVKDEDGKIIDYYGFQWWLGEIKGDSFYYARGILGQYIVAIPEWDCVFVRLGHKRDPTRNVEVPSDLYSYLNIVKSLLEEESSSSESLN